MADKTVTGKTTGVMKEIIDFLDLVAKYGGKDIVVLSGKRDSSEQAIAMYNNWTGTVSRGKIYVSGGAMTEAERAELDKNWDTAHDSKATADDRKKAEAEFKKLAAKTPSMHSSGKAVDLAESSLTSDMKAVIVKYMKPVNEPGGFHVQYKGKLPAEDTIKKELGVEE
jgi:hypothetical protein